MAPRFAHTPPTPLSSACPHRADGIDAASHAGRLPPECFHRTGARGGALKRTKYFFGARWVLVGAGMGAGVGARWSCSGKRWAAPPAWRHSPPTSLLVPAPRAARPATCPPAHACPCGPPFQAGTRGRGSSWQRLTRGWRAACASTCRRCAHTEGEPADCRSRADCLPAAVAPSLQRPALLCALRRQPPPWVRAAVEAPLVAARVLERPGWVDSVALNMYHDGSEGIQVGDPPAACGCTTTREQPPQAGRKAGLCADGRFPAQPLTRTATTSHAPPQSHFDDAARFQQPIVSLRLFSDCRLSWGTQLYGYTNGAFCVPLPRGCVMGVWGVRSCRCRAAATGVPVLGGLEVDARTGRPVGERRLARLDACRA